MSEWISVKDRLPDAFCKVLIAWKLNGKTEIDMALYDNTVTHMDVARDEITHWMPLPEPPKEG